MGLSLFVVAGGRVQPFQPFGLHLLFHILIFRPGKADSGRLGVDTVGLDQRGQSFGQTVEHALRRSFFIFLFRTLDLFPGPQLFVAVVEGRVGEDMRMSPNHLGPAVLQSVFQREGVAVFVKTGNEEQEKGKVAHFAANVGCLAGTDGLHQLVAFLNDIVGQRFGGLLFVPWTAVRGDKAINNGAQALQRCSFHILLLNI